jgi:hypothetical protein
MDNVTMNVKGDKLTIEIDLSKRGERSASGKTTRVASTCGNVPVPGGSGAIIGINCYVK